MMPLYSKADRDLVDAVADLWIESGGDADGFDFVSRYIREAIAERVAVKEAAEAESDE